MAKSEKTQGPNPLHVAEGVLKALFTTSPIKTTDVVIKQNGKIVVTTVDTPSHPSVA